MRITLLLTALVAMLFPTLAQPSYIHKMSPENDIIMPMPNGKYEYDAYLILLRKVENRKKVEGESYGDLKHFTHAYARFYQENRWPTDVSHVYVNGFELAMPPGRDHYEAILTDLNMDMMHPGIMWSVVDSTGYFATDKTPEVSPFQFPDIYYISDISDHIPMVMGENDIWTYSATRWNEAPGFALPKPDLMKLWIVGQTATSNTLANYQPTNIREVNQASYKYTAYGRWMSPMDKYGGVIPGRGAAVVRTYKFYPYKANDVDGLAASKSNWLIITIVETEMPLEFRRN